MQRFFSFFETDYDFLTKWQREAHKAYISSFKFCKNKERVLQSFKNDYNFSHWVKVIIDWLEKLWIEYELDELYCRYIIISTQDWNKIIEWSNYGLTNSTHYKIFEDKARTTQILFNHGYRTPKQVLMHKRWSIFEDKTTNLSAALSFAENIGYPLILKPNSSNRWRWVLKIYNKKDLLYFYELYSQKELYNDYAVLQECILWNDIRILYLNWEILIAYQRTPFSVVWDWESSIKNLVKKTWVKSDLSLIEAKIKNDYNINLETIIAAGHKIHLIDTANISTWGTWSLYPINNKDIEFCRQISNLFGANYFWLDVITNWSIEDWTIIEVNTCPWVKGAFDVSEEFKSSFAEKIIKAILMI